MADVVGQIDRALAATGRVVEGITAGQWTAPTPCAEWDVRTALNHTVGGMRIFAAQLTGTEAGREHEDDWLGDDPRAGYATAAELDRAAWHRPGVLDTTVRISLGVLPGPTAALIHLTEVCVHGADLAVATGQRGVLDEELCGELLATMRAMPGFDAFRTPGMFGPEVPVPAGSPTHERLLGFLGRELR